MKGVTFSLSIYLQQFQNFFILSSLSNLLLIVKCWMQFFSALRTRLNTRMGSLTLIYEKKKLKYWNIFFKTHIFEPKLKELIYIIKYAQRQEILNLRKIKIVKWNWEIRWYNLWTIFQIDRSFIWIGGFSRVYITIWW